MTSIYVSPALLSLFGQTLGIEYGMISVVQDTDQIYRLMISNDSHIQTHAIGVCSQLAEPLTINAMDL